MATNLKVVDRVISQLCAQATTVEMPVLEGGAFSGIAQRTTEAQTIKPASFAAASNGGGGYIPDATYLMYAVVAVDADGIESLPSFAIVLSTAANDRIDLSWNAYTDAVAYKVYRGKSGVSAAAAGKDLVLLATVDAPTVALQDDGYTLTQYAAAAAFEEISVKGSSQRPVDSRTSKSYALNEILVPVIKAGVVCLPVDPGTAGLPAMYEGANAYWDSTNEFVTTTAGGNVLMGKITFAYLLDDARPNRVAVRFNVN